jgi:hypothetical protein
MIQDHRHDGRSARKNRAKDLEGAPLPEITQETTPATALTTGGANDLKSVDAAILEDMRTRINELEDILQAFGLIR